MNPITECTEALRVVIASLLIEDKDELGQDWAIPEGTGTCMHPSMLNTQVRGASGHTRHQ